MNGAVVVLVMGGGMLAGALAGTAVGAVLDKRRTTGGRHRASKRVVRSGLVMCLSCLMLLAAALPAGPRASEELSRTSYPEIGAQMGVSWVG